jgi:hypothetical protein
MRNRFTVAPVAVLQKLNRFQEESRIEATQGT